MHLGITRGQKMFRIFNILILTALALLCLLPFVNVVAVAFSDKLYVSAGQVTFWPKGFSTYSFKYLLVRKSFWTAFVVSLLRVALGLTINLFLIVCTAYPLSKSKEQLSGRGIYAWFFFVTMLINGGLIPNYILISSLGLRDTIWSLVLPGCLPAFYLVLMLNFFRQIPRELEEAAMIDGAGHLRTLVEIYVPVSVPSIATIVLFCTVGHWNAWFDGMLYINTPSKVPLMTYLRNSITNLDMSEMSSLDVELMKLLSDRSLKCAQIIIAVIPVLCVYPFLQRYFVTGIVVGSVKG
ncbi:MAG: carbohydrate ABC transporter permease [Eubacteriales bacterium]|nr:carbohydrate ABC transporter permease [Eubacteriales bacterium]